eukprot:UN4688
MQKPRSRWEAETDPTDLCCGIALKARGIVSAQSAGGLFQLPTWGGTFQIASSAHARAVVAVAIPSNEARTHHIRRLVKLPWQSQRCAPVMLAASVGLPCQPLVALGQLPHCEPCA